MAVDTATATIIVSGELWDITLRVGDRPISDRPNSDRPIGDRPIGDRPFDSLNIVRASLSSWSFHDEQNYFVFAGTYLDTFLFLFNEN